MSKKRVFILGAGFSKQAGMPLATELTDIILNKTMLREHEEMQTWLSDLKKRLPMTKGASDDASRFPPNIEQLLNFAKYDEELCRMNQQLSPVGREDGDGTPWNKAEEISDWLKRIEAELSHVIRDKQQEAQKAGLGHIKRFSEQLSTNDTVLTFNYDTLVENALTTQSKAWNHGLNDKNNGGITVLKMHGSVDWILRKRESEVLKNSVRLFSKKDTNVEEHGQQASQEEEYALELWRVSNMDQFDFSNDYSGLAGLGQHKLLHKLPGSARTWSAAFKALKKAEEIYVVGFSMSHYDSMVQLHFTSVIREREIPPKAVIVDPNAKDIKENYRAMFGDDFRLTLVEEKAQNIDWNKIVA